MPTPFGRKHSTLPDGSARIRSTQTCDDETRPFSTPDSEIPMQTLKFVHWQDGDAYLGYLLDYPDYWTQGESLDDLKAHLVDLYHDLTNW